MPVASLAPSTDNNPPGLKTNIRIASVKIMMDHMTTAAFFMKTRHGGNESEDGHDFDLGRHKAAERSVKNFPRTEET